LQKLNKNRNLGKSNVISKTEGDKMTAVFISTDKGEKDITAVFSMLKRAARVSAVFEGAVKIVSDAEYLLLPLKQGTITDDTNCAAIVFDDSEQLEKLPDGCAVLCFCEKAAVRCSGKRRQVISCGLHNKDTVTLSSLEKGKPVLSLQRRLITFSGEEIDVGDFPLITSESDHRVLIASAVLLLLGGRELTPEVFCDQSSTTDPVPFSK